MEIKKLKKQIKYQLGILKTKLGINKPKLREDVNEWKDIAQEFEFNFHKTNKFRQSDEFIKESTLLFENFGFKENDFAGMYVADLGAGSRMRGKFFQGAKHIVLEPMADRCMKEIEWCDFKDADMVFSKPAEEYIPELDSKIDFLFSLNVLDHCYDFELIVENVYKYLKKEGLAFLSFDSHFTTSVGHPLILTEQICHKIFINTGFEIIKFTKGFSGEFYKTYPKPGYDNSSPCLNYWLKKK